MISSKTFFYILKTASTRLGLAVLLSGLFFHVLLTERKVSGIASQVESFAERSTRKLHSTLVNGDLASLQETLWLVLGQDAESLTFSSPELTKMTSGPLLIGNVDAPGAFRWSRLITLTFEGHALADLEYHIDLASVSLRLLWHNLPLYALVGLLILFMLAYVQTEIAQKLIKLESDLNRIANLSNQDPFQLDQFFATELEKLNQAAVPSYGPSLKRILGTLRKVVSNEKKLQMAEVARQVAHDIRSPLSALDLVWASTKGIPEERRQVMTSAISRIKDIANNLLQQSREQAAPKTAVRLLSSLVETLVSEKRHQYSNRTGLEIIFRPDVETYGLFGAVNATEFRRALSNIIDNSVEALEGKTPAIVSIQLHREQSFAALEVTDNGKGIPPHILSQIGQEGLSYGKQNTKAGSGLGLFQVRKMLEACEGRLEVESQPSRGTTVRLILPPAPAPSWFVEKIVLSPRRRMVVVDDEASIHGLWNERLKPRKFSDAWQVLHFSQASAFLTWLKTQKQTEDLQLLIDYEFCGETLNGLDVIHHSGLRANAILVTGHSEESGVLEKAAQLGLKIIPKELAGLVPVERTNDDFEKVV